MVRVKRSLPDTAALFIFIVEIPASERPFTTSPADAADGGVGLIACIPVLRQTHMIAV